MGYQKLKDIEFVYEYDFAVDGGAVGVVNLRPIGNALEAGLIIEDVTLYVETGLVSASEDATVAFGNSVDADGYFAAFPEAGLFAGAVAYPGVAVGDLLWDDTNDHKIKYVIPSTAAAQPLMTIGTSALTAGKAKCVFKCKRF